jgi:hypothetical protein
LDSGGVSGFKAAALDGRTILAEWDILLSNDIDPEEMKKYR